LFFQNKTQVTNLRQHGGRSVICAFFVLIVTGHIPAPAWGLHINPEASNQS